MTVVAGVSPAKSPCSGKFATGRVRPNGNRVAAKSKTKQPTRLPLQKKLSQDASGVSVSDEFHFAIDRMEFSAVDFIKTLGVSFAALFPIVNPVGDAPIFFGLTQNYPQAAQKSIGP